MMGDILIAKMLAHRETWVWIWDEDRRNDVLRSLGSFATRPELAFTWLDAAKVARLVRELHESKQEDVEVQLSNREWRLDS